MIDQRVPSPSSSPLYRLRGQVGSVERSFLLPLGTHCLGSSRSNDLVLPVAGVSRRHAKLDWRGSSLVLEDLESHNGTFVNGRRVRASGVSSGDVLRFGPIQLRLEEIDEGDSRLGLVLRSSGGDEASTPYLDQTTTFVSSSPALEAEATAGLVFPEGCVPGRSDAMSCLYRWLRSIAGADLPVLIEGETGVGKELVARILHLSSRRRSGPVVAINCAAIPGEMLEAEMFGVGEGVATGVRKRPGRIRAAEGGTLLLDEIAEMPLDLQAKLLRVLQEKEIQPLGARTIPVDVRVLAATNLDLLQRVEEGRFRRDLYYRVAGCVLRVPPLRERSDDVALLVEHFLRATAEALGKSIAGVTVRALGALRSYSWPGNVRELEHEVRRLAYLCADGQAIESSFLPEYVLASPALAAEPEPEPVPADDVPEIDKAPDDPPDTFRLCDHVQATERRVILRALDHVGGSQRQAARLLGISRTTLARKIEKLGIPSGPPQE